MNSSTSIKVIEWKPQNDREKRLEMSLQNLIERVCHIDGIHDLIKSRLEWDDKNLIFGMKPSYFYDIDRDWFWLRLYHKGRDGKRKRIVLTVCLSGSENQVPKPDLDA